MPRFILARRGLKAFALFDGRVESEELGDGYADGGEGEGGAQPSQEGAFEGEVVARNGAFVLELDGAVLFGCGADVGPEGGFEGGIIVVVVFIMVIVIVIVIAIAAEIAVG